MHCMMAKERAGERAGERASERASEHFAHQSIKSNLLYALSQIFRYARVFTYVSVWQRESMRAHVSVCPWVCYYIHTYRRRQRAIESKTHTKFWSKCHRQREIFLFNRVHVQIFSPSRAKLYTTPQPHRFLRQKIVTSEGGWVQISVLATFQKLRGITGEDIATIRFVCILLCLGVCVC